jgi:hypothetical protein
VECGRGSLFGPFLPDREGGRVDRASGTTHNLPLPPSLPPSLQTSPAGFPLLPPQCSALLLLFTRVARPVWAKPLVWSEGRGRERQLTLFFQPPELEVGREGGQEGGREGGREGGQEGGQEGGREGGRQWVLAAL